MIKFKGDVTVGNTGFRRCIKGVGKIEESFSSYQLANSIKELEWGEG